MKALLLSSMEKIFPDRVTSESELVSLSAFRNERTYFQLAVCPDADGPVSVSIASPLLPFLTLRRIGFVPSSLPAYPNRNDDGYLTLEPGLFPDPLFETAGCEEGKAGRWLGFWISFRPELAPVPGEYRILVRVRSGSHDVTKSVVLTVLPESLPPQKLRVTQWFHSDSISELHGLPVFSEGFWAMVEKYLRVAVENGINMILTPLFTPPLDTEVGGERLTVQLIGVKKTNGVYSFDFSLLDRWIDLCLSVGVKYLEMSHLFTQWGAKACPKIIADVDGSKMRIFGWDTPALGDSYKAFLSAFLPELTAHLRDRKVDKISYFHISDEPHGDEARAQYVAIHEFIAPYLEGFSVMDALSDYSFYESGAVQIPVPKENGIKPFVEHGVKPLWTYYCCSQTTNVPNRFFALPGYRVRIFGILAYVYGLDGFLQWGYNFYHTQYSKAVIDPFKVTDAGGAFPSGDAFSVYPGADGPLESQRLNLFHEGLFDLRALELLETRVGRAAVIQLISDVAGMELSFESYPRTPDFIYALRERVRRELAL